MNSNHVLLSPHYRRSDYLMLPILWGLFVMGLGLAPWWGTWKLAVGVGLLLAGIPTFFIFIRPGSLLSRLSVAVSFMLFCALHIHQAMGVTELHFGIFVLLAVLLCYRDWRVIVTAATVAAVHHLSFNYLQQLGWNTICFVEPSLGRVIAHAAYVVMETTVLTYIAVWLSRDAVQAAELQRVVDGLVQEDSHEINLATDARAYRSAGAVSLVGTLSLLSQAVERARTGVESNYETLAHITRSNTGIQDGASEQASRVDATVRAVEEINAVSLENQEHATRALKQAQEVSDLAEEGSSVMQSSVQTMKQISESSTRIGDITAVIDSIAFQTNILALNAAVEAARAGEQGKGFAVVAGEVRALAHRSGEAAKEIRGLIEASGAQVSDGSARIQAAGDVMAKLLEGVSELTALISRSKDASQAQSHLIQEVDDNIKQVREIAYGNLSQLRAAAGSIDQLEKTSSALLESVQRFSTSTVTASEREYPQLQLAN